jgi:hypothetical protein
MWRHCSARQFCDERLRIGTADADHAVGWSNTFADLPAATRLIAIHPGAAAFSLARRCSWKSSLRLPIVTRRRARTQIVTLAASTIERHELRAHAAYADHLAKHHHAQSTIRLWCYPAANITCSGPGVMQYQAVSGTPITALFDREQSRRMASWSAAAQVVRLVRSAAHAATLAIIDVALRDATGARRTALKALTGPAVLNVMIKTCGTCEPLPKSLLSSTMNAGTRSPYWACLPTPSPLTALPSIRLRNDRPATEARRFGNGQSGILMAAQTDNHFYNILCRADLHPGWRWLLWAARWLKPPLLQSVTGLRMAS